MAPPAHLARQANTCQSGFSWYVCDFDGADYSGCCSVDACSQNPVGCPDAFQQPSSSSASQATSSAASTSASSSASASPSSASPSSSVTSSVSSSTAEASSVPAPATTSSAGIGASAGISGFSATTSATAATGTGGSSSGNGLSIPVGALVGIVIGCIIAAIVGTLCLRLCWVRRRRQRDEKGAAVGMLHAGGGPDHEKLQGSENSPELTRGGFESTAGSTLGPGTLLRDSYLTNATAHSSMISPITACTATPHVQTPNLAERYDSPVHELDTVVSGDSSKPPAELQAWEGGSQQAPLLRERNSQPWHSTSGSEQEPIRATLNSTPLERQSGTYANSWTKFNNVQV